MISAAKKRFDIAVLWNCLVSEAVSTNALSDEQLYSYISISAPANVVRDFFWTEVEISWVKSAYRLICQSVVSILKLYININNLKKINKSTSTHPFEGK